MIFVIVVVVLGKFAWGPVLGLLQQREEFIHKSLSDAKHDRDEAEARLKDTRRSCRARRPKRRRSSTKRAATPSGCARNSGSAPRPRPTRSSTNAERQIQLETARALQQIRREAVDLSVTIASKLIQRNLSKEDNERLIDEALQADRRHPVSLSVRTNVRRNKLRKYPLF